MKFIANLLCCLLVLMLGGLNLEGSPMFKKKKKKKTEAVEQAYKLHPQNSKAIEKVFNAEGQDFYKFQDFADLPQERQTMAMQFLAATGQVMDNELLLNCLDNLAELFLKKDKRNEVKVSQDFLHQISIMRDMANTQNYTDAFYQVASACTFTLDENIYEYDPLVAQGNIMVFKRLKHSFFLKTLSEKFPAMAMQLPKDLEKALTIKKVQENAYYMALHSMGIDLPTSAKEKMSSIGLAETS